MPIRQDIEHILIIGSGPIIIGQACEFDYSGAQACKALREEGYRVSLVNSNPATIMTDPEFADATYVEPLTVESVTKIIEKEKPDALLPTLGGQTGLNLSLELFEKGILKANGVEMIGAKPDAIKKGEDRELFKQAMLDIGLDVARSFSVNSVEEAQSHLDELGDFPIILRPAYTLGGTGGGIAYNREEFDQMMRQGLEASPISQVLMEECLLGWKEYEMEVMRDYKDQCVVICSIENFDPMGVHTGDSITIAPAMTLSDKEYQLMRDASFACIREIGVETGGSNIQFSTNPENGRMVVIEMNPRVSRSSALASKATGFPIAKFAAKLAVGYSLDELQNDVTKETPACFEPSIDYVVTKVPRFTFEKFPDTDSTLTSAMKSVGEAMAIGRTFKESFQKAMRSLEIGLKGFEAGKLAGQDLDKSAIRAGVKRPSAERRSISTKLSRMVLPLSKFPSNLVSIHGLHRNLKESISSKKKFPECPLIPWTMNPFVNPKKLVSQIVNWRITGHVNHLKFGRSEKNSELARPIVWLIPVLLNLRLTLPTTTHLTETRMRSVIR